jgi:hypothetical protein
VWRDVHTLCRKNRRVPMGDGDEKLLVCRIGALPCIIARRRLVACRYPKRAWFSEYYDALLASLTRDATPALSARASPCSNSTSAVVPNGIPFVSPSLSMRTTGSPAVLRAHAFGTTLVLIPLRGAARLHPPSSPLLGCELHEDSALPPRCVWCGNAGGARCRPRLRTPCHHSGAEAEDTRACIHLLIPRRQISRLPVLHTLCVVSDVVQRPCGTHSLLRHVHARPVWYVRLAPSRNCYYL